MTMTSNSLNEEGEIMARVREQSDAGFIEMLATRRSTSTVKLARCDLYLRIQHVKAGVEHYKVELSEVRPPTLFVNQERSDLWAGCIFPIRLNAVGDVAEEVLTGVSRFVMDAQQERIVFLKEEKKRKAAKK